MKFLPKVIFAILTATCFASLHASEITFAKSLVADGVIAMKELSQGGYIASSPDHGSPTLIRFDKNGNVVSGWEYVVRNRFHTYLDQLIETQDGGFLATGSGNFKDPIIVKLNSTGLPQWQIVIHGKYHIESTAQTTGGYIAVGSLGRTNSVESDAWVIKLNGAGGVLWSKLLEQRNGDKFRFVQQTPDGGYIVAGTVDNYQSTGPKVMIAKLNAQGDLIWNHSARQKDWTPAITVRYNGIDFHPLEPIRVKHGNHMRYSYRLLRQDENEIIRRLIVFEVKE